MAAEQLTDKENQFKKRARRRLVGAVALVLLMITVLPLVLDDRSGQKAPQPEIAISIPSQDGEFNSKIIPVAAPAASTPPLQMTAPIAKAEEPKAAAPETPKNGEPKPVSAALDNSKSEPEAKPAEKVVEAASASTPTPAPKAEPEPAKKPEESKPKVAEKAVEKPADAKAAEPKESKNTESKKPDVKPAVKKGAMVVQIGVFSDAAKVKQLKAKLADKGVQCYTENLQTPNGVKIRLRCGPYSGKPEAQQALDKVKAAGFDGMLVTSQ